MADPSSSRTSAPPSSPTRSPKKPRSRVIGAARIQKASQKKKSPSPRKILSPKEKTTPINHDRLGEDEREVERRRHQEMEEEKSLFPRADEWADEEARLFEVLFMRQYSPLLPTFWDMDFKGIPIPDILFQTSEVDQPVIYSHSANNFHATRALINLIELTTAVRCCTSADQKEKAPNVIKKGIDQYISWAATDGGYDKLDVIPNILTAVANLEMTGGEITNWMSNQLQELAQRHRDFLRVSSPDASSRAEEGDNGVDELSMDFELQKAVGENDAKDEETPRAARRRPQYRRKPPVLYGIFVVNSTAMILTVDASKEPGDLFISYQVEVGLNRKDQGVWNAMTIAIVVCLARDQMMARKEDFQLLPIDSESDPDL